MVSFQEGGDSVALSDDKTRVLIAMPKEMKAELEKIAKKEDRSLTNLIVRILKDYLENI
jgi:metal-responsive CopG/Arc/MetJ family transcriptional regulator